jgi:hypothetical protein
MVINLDSVRRFRQPHKWRTTDDINTTKEQLMTSRILKQFRTAGRPILLVLVGIVFLLGSGLIACAQSEQSGSEKGLEGTWRVQVTPYDCATGRVEQPFAALLSFARGGTLSGTSTGAAFQPGQRTSDYGTWGRVDAHTYKAVSDAFILFTSAPNPPVPGFQRGTQRITQTIKVNDDQFTSVASSQFFDVTGKLVMTHCATATGQRFN